MHETLKQCLTRLNEEAQRDRTRRIHTKFAPAEPLDKQIDRWLSLTPPDLLARPWTMTELQRLFVGRYRELPHAQHVAGELRKRGWYSRRTWTQPGYGRRLWFAPIDFG